MVTKPITFFADPKDRKTWHAFAGVNLEAQPGQYGLDVTATLAGGRVAHSSQQVTVAAADFKTGDISVPENYVNPNDAEQKQIAADEALKKRAYAHSAPHPLWSGNFIKSVNVASTPTLASPASSTRRKPASIPAPTFPFQNTPVVLSNSGTVVLVHDLFYEGNTVIVDHGLGLFTVYLHMSRIDVHEGDKLDKGAKLGLSGASGRVTGPHPPPGRSLEWRLARPRSTAWPHTAANERKKAEPTPPSHPPPAESTSSHEMTSPATA